MGRRKEVEGGKWREGMRGKYSLEGLVGLESIPIDGDTTGELEVRHTSLRLGNHRLYHDAHYERR